jgi:peptide/nickel transport system substrate-binding protein
MKKTLFCACLLVIAGLLFSTINIYGADKKIAKFTWLKEPDTLNPMYTGTWFSRITQQIWNCDPWVYDDTNIPVPVLLTKMPSVENGGISADGKTMTFSLRNDITWSDKAPITAADFVFTWEMYNSGSNTVNSTYPYDVIKSVKAVNTTTVVMKFDKPFVAWAGSLGQEILPEHILRPIFEADGTLDEASWNLAPEVGCGPYVFKEWESGSYAHFVKNKNYYGTTPKIDEIFLRFVPNRAAQASALQTGDANLGTLVSYSDIPTLKAAGVNILPVVGGYNEGWYFNFAENTHPAIKDLKVRQAIAMGFDRFSLVKDMMLGMTEPAASFWHNTPWQDPALEPWPYDIERAKKLLDEAGWTDSDNDGIRDKDGLKLIIIHGSATSRVRQDTQAIAQQHLSKIGVQLKIQNYAPDVFYSQNSPCAKGELDICEYSGAPDFPDPNTSRFLCKSIPSSDNPGGRNMPHLCDRHLDDMFKNQSTEISSDKRKAIMHEISQYMTENVYWLGVWHDPDIWAYSSKLSGVNLSGPTPFYNIAEWDIVP